MNAPQLDQLRHSLLEERKRLQDALDYLKEENPGSLEDETAELSMNDDHLAETATATVDREIDYTIEESVLARMGDVDTALERMDSGEYGRCQSCGCEIAPERLEAVPWARLCIDCKRQEERLA
ncbi:MAG: TraR/DksA family transcriptional regulator [Gaiellaceae bacterium]